MLNNKQIEKILSKNELFKKCGFLQKRKLVENVNEIVQSNVTLINGTVKRIQELQSKIDIVKLNQKYISVTSPGDFFGYSILELLDELKNADDVKVVEFILNLKHTAIANNMIYDMLLGKTDKEPHEKATYSTLSKERNKFKVVLEELLDFLRQYLPKENELSRGDFQKSLTSDEPFDKVAFSDNRSEAQEEENNDFEDYVFKDLKQFIKTDRYALDDKTIDAFQHSLHNDLYTDVIKAPDSKLLFRGMCKDEEWIQNLIGDTDKQMDKVEISNKFYKTRYGKSSSWSSDVNVAISFATQASVNGSTKGKYYVLLIASSEDNSDNFIEGNQGFYKIDMLNAPATEEECIALGPVKIRAVIFAKCSLGEAAFVKYTHYAIPS